jgi:hypothetical protein
MGLILSIENTIQAYNSNNLLLDRFAEGLAAAYSLSQLFTTYTGDAIRVRRSSDNAEADIGFDGTDLDTSSLTSFCSGTDGFVTTWYDQSGKWQQRYSSHCGEANPKLLVVVVLSPLMVIGSFSMMEQMII